MASKKLFFNFNMILRDIRMHWPIWVMSMLGYVFTCTIIIALSTSRFDMTRDYEIAYRVIELLTDITHMFAACMGLVAATAGFGYLTKRRKHYFYESLPFNRLSLFATRYLFGVIAIMIPVISIYIIELIQTTFFGYFAIAELTQWLIVSTVEYLFWYSLGVLVIMLCGRIGMAGFCYIALAVAWLVLNVLFDAYSQLLYIGVKSGLGIMEFSTYNILSPIEFFANNEIKASYDIEGTVVELYQDGTYIRVLIAFVAGVLLTVGSYLLYTRRKSEKTEDNFVFPAVKVIFNWCFAFFSALGFGLFFIALFISAGEGQAHIPSHRIGILVILIIVGFVGYMASCMIAGKRLRVIKQNMVKCGICIGVLVLFMIGMFCDVLNIEKYVPDKDDCIYAQVSGEYFGTGYRNNRTYNKAGIDKSVDLLQLIVDNFDDVRSDRIIFDDYYGNTKMIGIYIDMKKGYVRRQYYVPEGSTLDKKLKEFMHENGQYFKDDYRDDDFYDPGYYEYGDPFYD